MYQSDFVYSGNMLSHLQRLSEDHVAVLGAPDSELRKRGMCWIVVRHNMYVERWPETGEKLLGCTWTGKTTHFLYPRYYRLCDERGNTVVNGASTWSVMDLETRRFPEPEKLWFSIEDETDGAELPLRPKGLMPGTKAYGSFTVSPYDIDRNGHMNNARYPMACEKVLPWLKLSEWRGLYIEYMNEARLGETVTLYAAELPDGMVLSGSIAISAPQPASSGGGRMQPVVSSAGNSGSLAISAPPAAPPEKKVFKMYLSSKNT